MEEQSKKESSSGTCSKKFFNVSSGKSRCEAKDKEKAKEPEVQQSKQIEEKGGGNSKDGQIQSGANEDIETVAESLGVVAISADKQARKFSMGTSVV
ncbi:hypothetical protein RYX36_021169 [Vicia faba]